MRSKYLASAEDLEVGDCVYADGGLDPVEVLWLGQMFARVRSTENGYEWTLMRNRLTKGLDHDLNTEASDGTLADSADAVTLTNASGEGE